MVNVIEDIVEYTDFRPPNKRVLMYEVHYITPKGFRGTMHLEKQGATKESVRAAVDKAAELPELLIGEKTVEKK